MENQSVSQPRIRTDRRYVGVKETLLYGVANGGQCIGYNMIKSQMSFFYVAVFGIHPDFISALLFFMAFWDAFNDPLMGSIVDKTRTRFGKLRPYLIVTPFLLGIVTIVLFGGPLIIPGATEGLASLSHNELFRIDSAYRSKVIFTVITYVLWKFFYTIGDIPFWGLSAAISPNPDDRSRVIKSARLISGILGGIPGIIITVCIDFVKEGGFLYGKVSLSQVFFVLGIVGGTIGMGLFSLSGFCLKERVVQRNEDPKLLDCFRYLFKNKPLFLLTLSSLISTLEGIGGSFSVYFYTLSLGINSLSLLAGIPGTVVGWLTYPLMTKLESRWTSKQIVIRISLIHAAVTVLVFLIGCRNYTNIPLITILLALQGFSGGINGSIKAVIPTKMISETVDYMEWKTGDRNEGMAFSLLTFIGKLTSTLATSISTALIPLIGLVKGEGEQMIIDPNTTLNTKLILWGLVTCIPTLLGLFALIPYKFYDLEGEKLETIQREVQERREVLAENITTGGKN